MPLGPPVKKFHDKYLVYENLLKYYYISIVISPSARRNRRDGTPGPLPEKNWGGHGPWVRGWPDQEGLQAQAGQRGLP
jgi:hypothetical protein